MAQRLGHWRQVGQTKAKAWIGVLLVIGLQSTWPGHSFQGFSFSHSVLVQREQCKQHREIKDRSKKQMSRAGDGPLKGEACAVVEKDASKNESPYKVDDS